MDDLFKVKFPAWANTTPNPKQDAKESIKRARDVAGAVYALGVQTGVHAVIEWCGVLGEHVRMIEHAYHAHNIPPERRGSTWGRCRTRPRIHDRVFLREVGVSA